MRSQYAWRYAGDAVEIQLGKACEDRSVMLRTLPALWQRRDQKRTDADVVSLDSPVHKKTKPNPEMPLSKEQQVLADRVAASLETMRHAGANTLSAACKRTHVDLLEAAALDVLDATQTPEGIRAIREVVVKAEDAVRQSAAEM